MEEHGRIVQVMAIRQGTSQRTGEMWQAQDFLLEIDGRYSRKVRFSLWGVEKVSKACLKVGDYVTVKAEVEAHETKGEWYNDIRVYDIERFGRSVLRESSSQPVNQCQYQGQLPVNNQPTGQYQQLPNGQIVAPAYINPSQQPIQQPVNNNAAPRPYTQREENAPF